MRILLTRPLPESRALAQRLRRMGHSVRIAPMLEIRAVGEGAIPQAGVAALVFTSANGVRFGAPRIEGRDLPAWCVGPRTAAAARRAGFSRVVSADGDALALADRIAAALDPAAGTLLHPAGRDHRPALADRLRRAGFHLRTEIVYEAQPVTALPPHVVAALKAGDIDLVLLYSSRTAAAFARAVQQEAGVAAMARLVILALSPAVAAAAGSGYAEVVTAPAPHGGALLGGLEAIAKRRESR
ncbi:MAG: uroporphyrinogen-III synthase [Rhodothalassiaceae bacterium]